MCLNIKIILCMSKYLIDSIINMVATWKIKNKSTIILSSAILVIGSKSIEQSATNIVQYTMFQNANKL